jgi:hypothetical protein
VSDIAVIVPMMTIAGDSDEERRNEREHRMSPRSASPAVTSWARTIAQLFRPEAEFAARIRLEPITIPGAHQSLLAHPDEVADAILR